MSHDIISTLALETCTFILFFSFFVSGIVTAIAEASKGRFHNFWGAVILFSSCLCFVNVLVIAFTIALSIK